MTIEDVVKMIEADYDMYLKARENAYSVHDLITARMFEAKMCAIARIWHAIEGKKEGAD